jgi:hypothetical protein
MAIEVSSGRLVVVAICESVRLRSLAAARGLTHRHLATLVDVVRDVPAGAFPDRVQVPSGAGVAIAEHLPGITLKKALDDGPLHTAKAVAWVLRLADAVQALHAIGTVHGAISPRSVLAGAEGRPIAPVLSQLLVPPVGAFCPPERLRGANEAPSDDVWALYATLYAAVTGKAPFKGSTRETLLRAMSSRPAALSTFGVIEPALQEILLRGLSPERRGRTVELSELVGILDDWERDPKRMPAPAPLLRPAPRDVDGSVGAAASGATHADGIIIDDAELPDDQGRSADSPDDDLATVIARPAATPAAEASLLLAPAPSTTALGGQGPRPQPPAAPKRPSINPFERKGMVLPWLLAAVALGGAVVYAALGSRGEKDPKPAAATTEVVPSPTRPVAKPSAKKPVGVERDECVVSHFAPGSFVGRPDFAFVCQDSDFPGAAGRLHAMLRDLEATDAGADGGEPDAGQELALDVVRAAGARQVKGGTTATRFGWYELPITAIIRKTCCAEATPVVLHEIPGRCEQLQAVVRRLADDSATSVDLAPGARNFDKAVGCLYAQRIPHGYVYERPPTPANRARFQQFLGRAAIIGARR